MELFKTEKYNDEYSFDDEILYKAKVIGNNNRYTSYHCRIDGIRINSKFVFALNGLVITINVYELDTNYERIPNYEVRIALKNNPSEMVYVSDTKYIPGDWENIFNKLYEETINQQNNKPKTLVKKELPNK